ncbi:MAG: protein phosphatase 2C domain-containing protein [Anaerolineae bacterium]|nr:protein phosphatase 2C domain-containing protein [Thermoflexales bacterium]MDW8406608.1 protein phosphatase 2C domain-containing protein [Anaerolineae bacterium]
MTTRPVAVVAFGSQTDIGRERDQNQDSLLSYTPLAPSGLPSKQGWLFVVADGMGGHLAGEVASQVAVESIVEHFAASDAEDVAAVLQQSIAVANEAVCRRAHDLGVDIMGTTLVCAVIRDDQLFVAHVGDSRAYLLRDQTLTPLTRDHSLVNEQIRQGLITETEARDSELRGIVTRALGMKGGVQADIAGPIALHTDDVVLLCTDGVCGYVPEIQIRYILQTHRTEPQSAAELLIEAANAVGGFDNATAVVAHVQRIEQAALEEEETGETVSGQMRLEKPAAVDNGRVHRPAAPAPLMPDDSDTADNLPTEPPPSDGSPASDSQTERTNDRLTAAPSPAQPEPLIGWRELIPISVLIVVLLAEAIVFAFGARRTTTDPTPAPAPSITTSVGEAGSTSVQGSVAVQPLVLSISVEPQPPLTAFTQLEVITTQLASNAPAAITLTFRTNATVIEPTHFETNLDLSRPKSTVRIELAPQVNFNRQEQVKIEALAEAGPADDGQSNTWTIGAFGLPSQPDLRLRSRLTILMTLTPMQPVPSRLPMRISIRWLAVGAIPGDFKPAVSW